MAFSATLIIPDIYKNGIPIQLTVEQIRTIGEFGSVSFTDEAVYNLNRIIAEYIIQRMQLNSGETYANIRNHGAKVCKQVDKLIELINPDDETSFYYNAFIEGALKFWMKGLDTEKLKENLELLKDASNFMTEQKGSRNKNYAFIGFIHYLAELYLIIGGDKSEFPTGASKLNEQKNFDGKEYESLFVDFVEQIIASANEILSRDMSLAKKVYTHEDYSEFKNWYEPIETYQYQTLAKKIQRALADKPLH